MKLPDYRMEPPPEPSEIGFCQGCREAILANELFLSLENGQRLHDHPDCKVHFVDRMTGKY